MNRSVSRACPRGFLLLVTLCCLRVGGAVEPALPRFADVTQQAGIGFINVSAPEKRYIVESMAGGVALFDFDGDGWLDIYLLNSYTVEAALAARPRPPAALYRNRADGTFEEGAERANVADPCWAMGVAVADYDNDGWDDLYVTCVGPNRLFRNRGDGTFQDVSSSAGVDDPRFSTGAAWGDYDRDGDLDLFVANYLRFRLNELPEFGKGPLCQYKGVPVQCGPRGLPGEGDTLYRNNGDGTFTDVSRVAGVEDSSGYYGLAAVWSDFDGDGWPDLFVANDATPNYLYRNNRDGTFTEEGFLWGLAVREDGTEQGCMGITLGDYDRNGLLDLVVTNFSDDYNTFYQRMPEGYFADMTHRTRTVETAMALVGWGTRLFDFDHDGWLDLFVANGHVYPQIEGAYPGGQYRQRKLLYRNCGDGTFEEIGSRSGVVPQEPRVSRGAAFGDWDRDGDVDIVINDLDGPPMLLRNETGAQAGNWIQLRLEGIRSNRNAVGARVILRVGSSSFVDEVRSGDSYLSHSDWRLHFGLGKHEKISELKVVWPSGQEEVHRDLPVNRHVKVVEGKGIVLEEGGMEEIRPAVRLRSRSGFLKSSPVFF